MKFRKWNNQRSQSISDTERKIGSKNNVDWTLIQRHNVESMLNWRCLCAHWDNQPIGHMTFIQHHINVDATSWRCIDVDARLSQCCVPAGKRLAKRLAPSSPSKVITNLGETGKKWKYPALRKHAYSDILKILPPKNGNFPIKNSDIFHVSAQNIDCGNRLDEAVLTYTHSLCFEQK